MREQLKQWQYAMSKQYSHTHPSMLRRRGPVQLEALMDTFSFLRIACPTLIVWAFVSDAVGYRLIDIACYLQLISIKEIHLDEDDR